MGVRKQMIGRSMTHILNELIDNELEAKRLEYADMICDEAQQQESIEQFNDTNNPIIIISDSDDEHVMDNNLAQGNNDIEIEMEKGERIDEEASQQIIVAIEEEDLLELKQTVNHIESCFEQIREIDKNNGYVCMYKGSSLEELRIYLMFDPKKKLGINELVAAAWGIDLSKYICVSLTFSGHYLSVVTMPQIDAFQCGNTNDMNSCAILDGGKVQFGLYWTVQERLKNDFFKQYWPHDKYERSNLAQSGKNYMLSMLEFTEQIIRNSPNRCLICGNKMPYSGLKPTVCDLPLCIFSHEQYGLGVDLESSIKKNPDIVDLLITLTYAASISETKRFNPFNPFPMGLEVKTKGRNNMTVTHNFLNSRGERDNFKVRTVIEKIPPIQQLSKWVDEGNLKEKCDAVDPLLYMLLRWILASNRCHLKKLEPQEQIREMETPHQYILLSSTPSREKRFQELKSQYGSVYAFHGSPLGNWHSIMRNGLENMSGTEAQLHGAAYGKGVYLAPTSNTSVNYMKYVSTWSHSMFNSPTLGCMTMCEVIKHSSLKGQPNPFYVVADETLLTTRYFFLYTNQTQVHVDGCKVKPPPITVAWQ
jgi:hypothetical protein